MIVHAYVMEPPLKSQEHGVWRVYRLVKTLTCGTFQHNGDREAPVLHTLLNFALCISLSGGSLVFFSIPFII